MEGEGDQGPDAAPIKPVSSLRAKFENLQGQNAGDTYIKFNRPVASNLKPVEPVKQNSLTRASLDLPRPHSPWTFPGSNPPSGPQTPGPPSRASESPTRSNHKRPMSMVLHSSPQLTPAVHVESPKSPPVSFFGRNISTSPDRAGTGFSEKKGNTVQKSTGKSYIRAAIPIPVQEAQNVPERTAPETDYQTHRRIRSRSPVPPQVNRADKPKIPAKPRNISPVAKSVLLPSSLATKPVNTSNNRRISPFNTPPSSDDEASPFREPEEASAMRLGGREQRMNSRDSGFDSANDSDRASRSRDPRLLGFNGPRPVIEKKDPRQLGFSSSKPPAIISTNDTAVPAPPKVISTPIVPSRSALEFGFGAGSPTIRQVHQPLHQRPSPPRPDNDLRIKPARDARQFGFGAAPGTPSTPITPIDLPRRESVQRSMPKIPPPRPSEDSKRPTYLPGITQTQRIPSPGSSTAGVRRSEDVPRQAIAKSTDLRFPPPPKRVMTGHEDDSRKNDLLNLPAPLPPRRQSSDIGQPQSDDSDEIEEPQPEPTTLRHEYPDATHTNRRPPAVSSSCTRIHTKSDGRAFDMCGRLLCTAHYHTKIFDLESGSELLDLNHGETVKTTAIIFKPAASIDAEGKRIWIGNNIGDLQEIDLDSHTTIAQSSVHNRKEIFRILRHERNLWTLDEEGKLFIWPGNEDDLPSLKNSHKSHRLSKPPTFAMVVRDTLWAASGKELRVYRPGYDAAFNVLQSPLVHTAGDVTCGTYSEADGQVYIGHTDGTVAVYDANGYQCVSNVKVSIYKINSMAMVADKLWAVYKTGKVYVYDTSTLPWKVKKDWKAHTGPATGILLDQSSAWTSGRLQVATTGQDQFVRLWDGMLEDDWVEIVMHTKDTEYCTFRDVRAAVTTWNCGAISPLTLRTDFIADAIHAQEADPPEILVFGFQEVVDLEDRAVTAKSIFGFGKKKESKSMPDQQHQSKVYREWRDYLCRAVARYIPDHHYTELHTSSLIGLFSCIFVRTTEKANVSNHAVAQVKCGMGGHYGNKGALLARFNMDSSSLCFINCHLAAGQTKTSNRNEDVAAILESEALPAETDHDVRTSLYVGGGDGAQILDHEICILNGDLNYRIDTMPRDLVIKHINNGDLTKLLERDQINLSRKRVAGFRLAPFTELPITFPPTYKYDVGKDTYDTSEKKRSPAWCDRLLYRSTAGRVRQLEYVRHEGVTYSDHRPVSGIFKIKVKRVDEAKRREALRVTYSQFEKMRRGVLEQARVNYLVNSFGVGREEARKLVVKSAK